MASADGSLAFNTCLAENRANAAKDWVADRLGLTVAQKNGIKVSSRPEGWLPVLDSMKKDGNSDSIKVKDILERFADQNDDVQERHIRRLACWSMIRDRYLSKDRKVEYTYSYTIKSFTTDSELLGMYAKRPDAFNEPELLKVSTLMQTDAEKIGVYQTILKYFPDSETAKNNLAVLYLRTGNEEAARSMLRQLPGRYPDIEGKQLKWRESNDEESVCLPAVRTGRGAGAYLLHPRRDSGVSTHAHHAGGERQELFQREQRGSQRLIEKKADDLPFREYVSTLYYIVRDEQGNTVAERANSEVTGDAKEEVIELPADLPYGKYHVTVWEPESEEPLGDDLTAAELEHADAAGRISIWRMQRWNTPWGRSITPWSWSAPKAALSSWRRTCRTISTSPIK